jgi:hypothetical protein
MTVTIELPPEIEAEVIALADAQGLPVAEYVQHLLLEQVPVRPGASVSPTERAALWRESVKGLPHTPPLSDEAISRENIYGDRG